MRMRELFDRLRVAAKGHGWDIVITSGKRSCADQYRIYAGKEVLKCSYHLSGDAFDIGPGAALGTPLPGVPPDVIAPPLAWDKLLIALGWVAKELGCRWGGDFTERDPIHFDDGVRLSRTGPACCDGPSSDPSVGPGARKQTAAKRRRPSPETRVSSCKCCRCQGRTRIARRPHNNRAKQRSCAH